MIRSIAESIELMMATDTIFYPILQSNHLISTLIFSEGDIHLAILDTICCACDMNHSVSSTIYRCKASKVDTPFLVNSVYLLICINLQVIVPEGFFLAQFLANTSDFMY